MTTPSAEFNRREFVKRSILATAGGVLTLGAAGAVRASRGAAPRAVRCFSTSRSSLSMSSLARRPPGAPRRLGGSPEETGGRRSVLPSARGSGLSCRRTLTRASREPMPKRPPRPSCKTSTSTSSRRARRRPSAAWMASSTVFPAVSTDSGPAARRNLSLFILLVSVPRFRRPPWVAPRFD
jgi:hypothetical protein